MPINMDWLMNLGSKAGDFVTDPRNIRQFGELAADLGSGETFATATGNAASGRVQREAKQQATANSSQQQQDLIRMIAGILGPKEDMNTANKITADADKMTLELPVRSAEESEQLKQGQKPRQQPQLPLEAFEGNIDISPFY